MKFFLITLCFLVLAIGGLSSCSDKKPKKLIVGVSADYPPFVFKYRGELMGFEVDLVRAIAERTGYAVEFKEMNFDELFPAIENNTIDMIASAVTETKEREKKFDFSNAYYSPGFALVFKKDRSKIINDLDHVGGIIGVQKATVMEDFLRNRLREINAKMEDNVIIEEKVKTQYSSNNNVAYHEIYRSNPMLISTNESQGEENNDAIKNNQVDHIFDIKLYNKHTELLSDLKKDIVNAIFIEILQAEVIVQNYRELTYITIPYQDKEQKYHYGFVFPKHSKIKDKFNKVLEDIDSEGKIDILGLRWFSGYGMYNEILKSN